MSNITSKIQLATAVFAVAATATLAPVALADDTDTTTDTATASVGSAAGVAPTRSARKDRPLPTSQAGGSQSTPSTSSDATSSAGAAAEAATDRASTAVGAAGATGASAVGSNPLFQNPLIWFGQPNPNPPASTVIYNFEPLSNLPEFTRPMFGWLQDFNFEGCVLGLSNVVKGTVGPYGTATRSISTSGCA